MMAIDDPKFDAYDSDILIRSVDNVFFRCHLNFLSEKSDYFKNFKNSKIATNNCLDEKNAISLPEIVCFDYNSKVVKFVFQHIYGWPYFFSTFNYGYSDLTDKDCIDVISLIDLLVTTIGQNAMNNILSLIVNSHKEDWIVFISNINNSLPLKIIIDYFFTEYLKCGSCLTEIEFVNIKQIKDEDLKDRLLDSKFTKMALCNKKIEKYERFAKHNNRIIDNLNKCIAEPDAIYVTRTTFIKNNIKVLKKITF